MADLVNRASLEKLERQAEFIATVGSGETSAGATVTQVTNPDSGVTVPTIPQLIADAEATVKNLDWSPVGNFADGVTFTKSTDYAVYMEEVSPGVYASTQWVYTGSLPFTATAGTIPSEPTYQVVNVRDASLINYDNTTVESELDGARSFRTSVAGGDIYPIESDSIVSDGDTIPSGYTHLNTAYGIKRMVPAATGVISGLTETTATIGSTFVNLFPYDLPEHQAEAVSVYNAKLQARTQRAANFEIGGSVTILGDSITAGVGATNNDTRYSRVLLNALQDYQQGGYGQSNEVDFNWTSMGGVALTGQTAGSSGPIQRSQIISVGGTITITRPNATRIAFFFDRTTTSGSVEIRQNAVLLATIDCSGADAKNILSNYTTIESGGANVTLTVIDNPVEFLAIVPIGDNVSQPNISIGMQMAVSGFNTTDFLQDPAQLVSIGACGAYVGTDSIYVLAIGTNDIYTAARTPYEYTDNLRTIGTTLESYRPANTIVLVVPPKSNESVYPVAISGITHDDYRQAIYQLAVEQKWAVIDHSALELNEQSQLSDGLHPNDRGHQQLASNILKSFGLKLKQPLTGVQRDAIAAKSDVALYRRSADLTTFTGTTTREKTLTSMGVTANDFVVGVYIRWKTSGVMIPYQDCQNLASGLGLQMLRSFTGADYSVAKMFYTSASNDGTGFASPQGPLSASILNTVAGYNDAEIIVEFERSLKTDSDL
mgnify:CR=1 FL=1